MSQAKAQRLLAFIVCIIVLIGCQNDNIPSSDYDPAEANEKQAELIHQLNQKLIQVVSEDLFSPPVASRIYAYTNIAAYEAARHLKPEFQSMVGQLNDLDTLPATPETLIYHEIAMIKSYCEVAKHLVYRDFMVDSAFHQLVDSLREKYPDAKVFNSSIEYGENLARHIKEWADSDNYLATRNMPRYQVKGLPHTWEATAPMYGEALEPHWHKLRPFILDSSSQFRVSLPISFSEKPGSEFYKCAEEVYRLVNNTEEKDIQVAVYWDCNPGPTMIDGHIMQVRKQNTPGGHWVGIHKILAKKSNCSLAESTATYAKLCVGIADGFITAWDTKFTHHLLRPETYINRHIDPDWLPKLESPLFPEFTSAHSVISAVAATVLSEKYGNLEFYDDTNVLFGLPPKAFDNVWQAAEEAAQSRLLGGIHYRFACDMGFEQGKKIGQLLNQRIQIGSQK